eukprot:1161291-Pelagomonas_calceolata.AAC.2
MRDSGGCKALPLHCCQCGLQSIGTAGVRCQEGIADAANFRYSRGALSMRNSRGCKAKPGARLEKQDRLLCLAPWYQIMMLSEALEASQRSTTHDDALKGAQGQPEIDHS